MTAPPSFRRYRADDATRLAELARAAISAIDPALYGPEERSAWSARAADPEALGSRCARATTLLAEVGAEVAGFVALEPNGHVDLVFVHPRHRGRGIGRALLVRAEDDARALRLGRLYAEVSHAARPLFEGRSYRVRRVNRVQVGTETLTNWIMDKRLVALGEAQRIFVVGNSGSGKTTLARSLASALDRPSVSLDAVAFSDQQGTRRPLAESRRLLDRAPGFAERCIVEGCYADLIRALATLRDHLVWLDLPVETCIEHAERRPWEPDKWPSAEEQDAFLSALLAFIATYPTASGPTGRSAHEELFAGFPGTRELHRDRPAAEL